MYFYVYLQPEAFEEASADGEDATQNIATILNGFLQNCFLAVFEDDRWGSTIKEKLELWPETMTRRRMMSILVRLKKQKRFLYCLRPDYTSVMPDLDCVFEQASSIYLDLILVIACEGDRGAAAGVEVTRRRTYHESAFEMKRSEIAVYGKTCNPGEMNGDDFMEFHFAKALRHASTIEICDRVCGKVNFADNYRYTTKQFVHWLGRVLSDPKNCTIVFHFGQPSGQGDQFILHELASLKKGPLSATSVKVHFYDESLPNPTLPHQRFIMTDQIAIDIDRGMDFLDRYTLKCRDTYVNYQNPREAQKLLGSYSSGQVATHVL